MSASINMSQSTLGKWNPDVERVCLVFDDLQTSKRDILDKDVILPDGYTLEIGWRGVRILRNSHCMVN